MSDLPIVWLGEAHHEEAARALADWARTRGVVLSAPAPAAAPLPVDATVPERVEAELAHAQEAADDDGTARALARADAILRAHPESPAAPFLRAETLRAWSRLWLRQGETARAEAAWQDAAALDGGRVAGIGEKRAPALERVPLTVRAHAEVHVDGVARANVPGPAPLPVPLPVLPGEHTVVATRDGAVVYAAWVAVRGPLEIEVPDATNPCSIPALSAARREGDRVLAPGITCPAWVTATPSDHGVLVSRCERDQCTSLVEWRRAADVAFEPTRDRAKPLPAWATWTVIGIGAATVASVVLIAAGAFESRPVESRFVLGGARSE